MKNANCRSAQGSTLGFVVATTGLLVAIGIAFVVLLNMLGGQRELSHAVDAGTLNAANKASKVRITPSPQAADVFADCLASDGTVGLDNINKVQAKALLIMLNSRSLNSTGKGTTASDASFVQAFNAAREINDKLANALNKPANLHGFFTSVADENSLRMVNTKNKVTPATGWQTACLNRGQESNVYLQANQLPPKINITDLPIKTLADGRNYIQGYSPIDFGNNRTLNFVSFEGGQQTHLVSLKTVKAGSLAVAPISNFPNPVPNTFQCSGQTIDTQSRDRICWSAAICNHRTETAPAEMQGAFVHIKLTQDGLRFFPWQNPLLGLLPPSKTKKTATSVTRVFPGIIGGAGILLMQSTNGAQYDNKSKFATANNLLHALKWQGKSSQYQGLDDQLLSRVNQIKPGTSQAALDALLLAVAVPKTNTCEYWIAKDTSDTLRVFTSSTIGTMNKIAKAKALLGVKADGKESKIIGHIPMVKGNTSKVVEITFSPFPKFKMVPSGTLTRHELLYTPGTGVNGCLLDVEERDQTFVFTGKVSSPPAVEGTAVPPCGCVH